MHENMPEKPFCYPRGEYWQLIKLYLNMNMTIMLFFLCVTDSEVGADGVSVEVVEARHSTTVVYITLGCLAVFLVVVAALATYNHIRNNKSRPNHGRYIVVFEKLLLLFS